VVAGRRTPLNDEPLGGVIHMTLFEYLAIAYSLVLSFAAMRLLEGLPHAARSGRRYWPHLLLVVFSLLTCVTTFWVYWSFRSTSWDYFRFWLALANPGLNYFIACTLVPRNADSIQSWHQYFASVRRRYFVAFASWALVIAGMNSFLLSMPLGHPSRLGQLTYFSIATVGAFTSNEKVVSGIAPLLLLLWLVSALFLLQPGALAGP
jgi:hypothetical protein